MQNVSLTTLSNGIRIVSENQENLETTAFGVWVDAGSRNEASALNGISHLLEHMAFKGTTRRDAREIVNEIEAVGGHLNAYTSRENTAYFARILKEDLPIAVDLITDILKDSTFEHSELVKEQNVIEQEIGQVKDTPDDIIFDHFQSVAYPNQPIGRSILGEVSRVQKFNRNDLIGYMQKEYQGKRMVVAASGRVDHDLLVKLTREKLEDFRSLSTPSLIPAKYHGGDFRENKDLEQIHLVIGLPGVAFEDEDYFTCQLFSAILGGGMSSRLFQEVRENKGLCYSISSFTSSYIDSGLLGIYAGTGEAQVVELMPAIVQQLKSMTRKIGNMEVQKAKAQLKAGLMMSLESASSRCEHLARQVIVYGRSIPSAELMSEIDAVNGVMLKNFAEKLISYGDPTIAAMGPIAKLESYENFLKRLRAE